MIDEERKALCIALRKHFLRGNNNEFSVVELDEFLIEHSELSKSSGEAARQRARQRVIASARRLGRRDADHPFVIHHKYPHQAVYRIEAGTNGFTKELSRLPNEISRSTRRRCANIERGLLTSADYEKQAGHIEQADTLTVNAKVAGFMRTTFMALNESMASQLDALARGERPSIRVVANRMQRFLGNKKKR